MARATAEGVGRVAGGLSIVAATADLSLSVPRATEPGKPRILFLPPCAGSDHQRTLIAAFFANLELLMPSALLRACPRQPCSALTDGGPCPEHRRAREARRGTSSQRGYGVDWRSFKVWFINQLIACGVLPACGARWPGAAETTNSRCKGAGRIEADGLHLHHEPPLTAAERQDPKAVCDRYRVEFLCASCHSATTQHEQQA